MTDDDRTYTVAFADLVPDPASAHLDAADAAGLLLAAGEAPEGELPADVLGSIRFEDSVRLLLGALKVGGSLVRQVPGAREFVLELAAGLRDDGEPAG